jgi:FMN phosphatase YigB (HAD superfamily)
VIRAVLFDVGGPLNTEDAFEAAIDNDIVPAKLMGMRTVRLVTGQHRNQRPRSWDEMPDHEVEDAPSILRAIEALLAKDGR